MTTYTFACNGAWYLQSERFCDDGGDHDQHTGDVPWIDVPVECPREPPTNGAPCTTTLPDCYYPPCVQAGCNGTWTVFNFCGHDDGPDASVRD
jgi:hypothetical protein